MKIEMKGINKSFGRVNQVLKDAGFVLDDGGGARPGWEKTAAGQVHADENSDRRLHPRRGALSLWTERSDL